MMAHADQKKIVSPFSETQTTPTSHTLDLLLVEISTCFQEWPCFVYQSAVDPFHRIVFAPLDEASPMKSEFSKFHGSLVTGHQPSDGIRKKSIIQRRE